ncbi:hypothetical protein BDV06DRAFT_231252 [Aspergillus oleicola]
MPIQIQPLLLAGGRSSRMGTRKELLCLSDNIPIFEAQLLRLHIAFPNSTVFLSLPTPRFLAEITSSPRVERLTQTTFRLRHQSSSFLVEVIYDHSDEPLGFNSNSGLESKSAESNQREIGPAAGLLAAHRQALSATWLVVACDYPFFGVSATHQLRDNSVSFDPEFGSVMCFENRDAIYEPLLGVWSPGALELLEDNVNQGILGPKSLVLKTQGKSIRPLGENWLFNMNTRAEYEQVMGMSPDVESIRADINSSDPGPIPT